MLLSEDKCSISTRICRLRLIETVAWVGSFRLVTSGHLNTTHGKTTTEMHGSVQNMLVMYIRQLQIHVAGFFLGGRNWYN